MGAGLTGAGCCASKTNHGLCAHKYSGLIPYAMLQDDSQLVAYVEEMTTCIPLEGDRYVVFSSPAPELTLIYRKAQDKI